MGGNHAPGCHRRSKVLDAKASISTAVSQSDCTFLDISRSMKLELTEVEDLEKVSEMVKKFQGEG